MHNGLSKRQQKISWQKFVFWLLENPKTGGSRELFLPKNNFKTCSTSNFPKRHEYFGGLETSQRHEIHIWISLHVPSYIWAQHDIKIVLGT